MARRRPKLFSIIFILLASCATRQRPGAAYSLEEGIVGGKLAGFGLAEKQFLPEAQIPKEVLAKTRAAVKRLCVCKIAFGNCITIFAAASDEFLTNEHALASLLETRAGFVARPAEVAACQGEFLVQGSDAKAIPVNLLILKHGHMGDRSHEVGQARWYPAKYYEIKTEEYSDHRQDLALIHLKGITAEPLLAETELKKGEKIYHAGFSIHPRYSSYEQVTPLVSEGRVLEITDRNVEADFLGVNGTSGGPVVNEAGNLVGVFWGKERTWREEPLQFNVDAKAKFFRKYGYPRERSLFMPISAVIDFLK